MLSVGRLLGAAVFLYGVSPLAAFAAINLRPPVKMDEEVVQVKKLLDNPLADPYRLHGQSASMFDQLQDTHHMEVEGLGRIEKPMQMSESDDEPTAKEMVQHMKGLVMREPPAPIADQDKVHQRLLEDYAALESMVEKDEVQKADHGVLPDGVAAAYQWDITKAAREGVVQGMMLLQPHLIKSARYLGEFVLATVGAHEPRHRLTHLSDAKELADDVKRAEIDAFTDEGALIQWMDPTGEKFMYLWTVTVERPGTPEFVVDYVKHLAKVRYAYSQGREGVQQLVNELGYEDRHGLFDSHAGHHHDGDGHDHSGKKHAEAQTPAAAPKS